MNHQQPHGNDLFVTTESYFPNSGKTAELLELVQKAAKHLEETEGVLMYQVLAPKEEAPVQTITTWSSQANFDNFAESETCKALHNQDLMDKVNVLASKVTFHKHSLYQGWHK